MQHVGPHLDDPPDAAHIRRPGFDLDHAPVHAAESQRIDSGGTVQWAANGVAIATGSATQDSPMLVEDGAGTVLGRSYDDGAVSVAVTETGEKLKAELDDLLDEIDEVLETNAEDFVKSYVQKGGQ